MAENEIDFGYERIQKKEKAERVKSLFRNVASKYDLMNDLMSGGLHRIWKHEFAKALPYRGGNTYLDVAGGTGDIATLILKNLEKYGLQGRVIISDINEGMLEEGLRRAPNLSLDWTCGDAESLPFPDNFMDVYTIAFGLRNVTDKNKALQEAFRVLKPGGKFYCLEFSKVRDCLSPFYDLYSFKIVPKIGRIVAQDENAYRYLVESIRMFPNQETLKSMIENAGFQATSYKNLSQGIVAIHEGRKG
ncbi:Bifunctional demethylmenaquinone methyltransferase/2-methoxy-6-polyprenyl-1,4-benzoquinol methylase UbiE [Candidatus Bealeia paramacronuclearis]|uniref:Ubiquinone/menaquinone biosynthesis C-methyltransferase UbiE n=1 Tax=Candidatus Bealeia paramacronuclearis TaxID=1921001 RepID=A0ABZ2C6U9_9PROT|nr:Bifunctional demethylmenaquinone methyltransferase/2-methoxy-6-polyprenyl-1,4-benzoquinol methylase UbiE [Candidatus Bealeia paramacronuclearis]